MKKVLITGGTGGLGQELVKIFDHNMYEVHFTYRVNEKKAYEISHQLKHKNFQYQLDQSRIQSIKNLINEIPNDIDILINNSAVGTKTVESQEVDIYKQDERLMITNALGPLWISELFIKNNDLNKFRVLINISSVGGGITTFKNFKTADGMSKAALSFMTQKIAKENTHSNISIFSVCPGALETEMFETSTLGHLSEQERKAFLEKLPFKTLISPNNLAHNIFYLATQNPQIYHGANIDMSNGLGVSPECLG